MRTSAGARCALAKKAKVRSPHSPRCRQGRHLCLERLSNACPLLPRPGAGLHARPATQWPWYRLVRYQGAPMHPRRTSRPPLQRRRMARRSWLVATLLDLVQQRHRSQWPALGYCAASESTTWPARLPGSGGSPAVDPEKSWGQSGLLLSGCTGVMTLTSEGVISPRVWAEAVVTAGRTRSTARWATASGYS